MIGHMGVISLADKRKKQKLINDFLDQPERRALFEKAGLQIEPNLEASGLKWTVKAPHPFVDNEQVTLDADQLASVIIPLQEHQNGGSQQIPHEPPQRSLKEQFLIGAQQGFKSYAKTALQYAVVASTALVVGIVFGAGATLVAPALMAWAGFKLGLGFKKALKLYRDYKNADEQTQANMRSTFWNAQMLTAMAVPLILNILTLGFAGASTLSVVSEFASGDLDIFPAAEAAEPTIEAVEIDHTQTLIEEVFGQDTVTGFATSDYSPDAQVHYTFTAAEGDALGTQVFVHGTGNNPDMWVRQIELARADGYNVATVALPGHGLSYGYEDILPGTAHLEAAEELPLAIDAALTEIKGLLIERGQPVQFELTGHSLGGRSVLLFAEHIADPASGSTLSPDQISSVNIVNGWFGNEAVAGNTRVDQFLFNRMHLGGDAEPTDVFRSWETYDGDPATIDRLNGGTGAGADDCAQYLKEQALIRVSDEPVTMGVSKGFVATNFEIEHQIMSRDFIAGLREAYGHTPFNIFYDLQDSSVNPEAAVEFSERLSAGGTVPVTAHDITELGGGHAGAVHQIGLWRDNVWPVLSSAQSIGTTPDISQPLSITHPASSPMR